MEYLGAGAIGAIFGYYAGAQEFLGIQSEEVPAEEDPSPGDESVPIGEASPTEDPTTGVQAQFVDEFEDGNFEGSWQFRQGNGPDDDTVEERDGVLYHESPKEYNNGADMYTRESFEATGAVELQVEQRSLRNDYWGFGFGIRFDDGGEIRLKELKWGQNNDLRVNFTVPNEDNKIARIGDPRSPNEFTEYTITIDFENRVVRQATRGSETFDQELDFPDRLNVSPSYSLLLANGRGHEIEYNSVSLSSVS